MAIDGIVTSEQTKVPDFSTHYSCRCDSLGFEVYEGLGTKDLAPWLLPAFLTHNVSSPLMPFYDSSVGTLCPLLSPTVSPTLVILWTVKLPITQLSNSLFAIFAVGPATCPCVTDTDTSLPVPCCVMCLLFLCIASSIHITTNRPRMTTLKEV